MNQSTHNYFKIAHWYDSHIVDQDFFFFRDDDRESIEVAYRAACAVATAWGLSHERIAAWRMPRERGAWSKSAGYRGVGVIGQNREPQSAAALAN